MMRHCLGVHLVQHCGNHGAMSTKPWVNNLMGLTDDLTGGSSLMWRYHHQVSHHIHCNDAAFGKNNNTQRQQGLKRQAL
jgi:fatty acid desaturase (delta-4 desaturase)